MQSTMRSALLMCLSCALLGAGPSLADLFWIDTATAKVQKSYIDGSNVVDLVTTPDATAPIAMTIDTVNSKIDWTEHEPNNSRVIRANLDGTGVETIISHPSPVTSGFPWGVAGDPAGGRFYWADDGEGKIGRADLNGTNVLDVFVGFIDNFSAMSIALVNSKLYWTRFAATSKIQRSNLDGQL